MMPLWPVLILAQDDYLLGTKSLSKSHTGFTSNQASFHNKATQKTSLHDKLTFLR